MQIGSLLAWREDTMLPPNSFCDDIIFVERRNDVRIIVNIAGTFSLSDRRDARGQRRVFACRVVNLSAQAVALISAIAVKINDRIIADIEHLGRVEGNVVRLLDRGFVMSISASAAERDRLIDRIEWLEKHKNHDVSDRRNNERLVPANPYSRIILSDGRCETCIVIDASISGAAVSADTVPEIGTVLAVGTIIGRVVRHFEGGFAVRFIEQQSRDGLLTRVLHE